jgi:hypothetical protein
MHAQGPKSLAQKSRGFVGADGKTEAAPGADAPKTIKAHGRAQKD